MALNPNATVKQIPFSPRAIYARPLIGAILFLFLLGAMGLWKLGVTILMLTVFVFLAFCFVTWIWYKLRVYYDVTDGSIEADNLSIGIGSRPFLKIGFDKITKITVEQDIAERLFGLYHVRFWTGNRLFDVMTGIPLPYGTFPYILGSFEKKDAEKLKALVESKMKLAKKN